MKKLATTAFVGMLALGFLLSAPLQADEREEEIERQLKLEMEKICHDHCEDLAALVDWCVKKGLKPEAARVLQTIETLSPEFEDLPGLREQVASMAEGERDEDLLDEFAKKRENCNEENGEALFDLAEKLMKVGLFSRAYDLIQDAVTADPDHKKARKILGYEYDRSEDRWITEWEADQRKKHVLFEENGQIVGWVPKRDLDKWEQGLRPFAGEWVTVEEEWKKRSQNDFRAWEVESEHFVVKTNLGRAAGWSFCMLLEDFYTAWLRFYIGYFDQRRGSRLLFNKADEDIRHLIHLYPDRERYLRFVKSEAGNDQLLIDSAGFYSSTRQSSHFYFGEDEQETLNTLFHEMTHQLFRETKKGTTGCETNFWIVEGAATYSETWLKDGDHWFPGRKTGSPRLQLAKQTLGSGSFDLAAFLKLDHHDFNHNNRGLNYAMACALTHFLVHYDNELYKEDYVRMLQGYYGGELEADSLAEYTGTDLATLAAQFADYMKGLELR